MTPATTMAFVKAFKNRFTIMGWNQGIQGITKFTNQNNIVINIVRNYGQINEANLWAGCKVCCKHGGAKVQQRVAQNNHMMAQCL